MGGANPRYDLDITNTVNSISKIVLLPSFHIQTVRTVN